MTVCTECRRGTRDGAGQVFAVESEQVDAALCDAQQVFIDTHATRRALDSSLQPYANVPNVPPRPADLDGAWSDSSEERSVPTRKAFADGRAPLGPFEVAPASDPMEPTRKELADDRAPLGHSEVAPASDPRGCR